MAIVPEVANAMQSLLNEMAKKAAQECAAIKRQRKFSAQSLAQTFVLGFLANPNASDEDLAQMAGVVGVQVSTQAVEQRFSAELAEFLEIIFRKALAIVIQSSQVLAPLLDRFADVLLLESTTIALPPELAQRFPGCGGSFNSGQAAIKFQVQFSLKSGALHTIHIEPGRDPDQKTSLQDQPLKPGTLRIADWGYYDTEVFERSGQEKAYWLSRLMCGTNTHRLDGKPLNLLKWLAEQGSVVDDRILLGTQRKLECRMIAWRVPEAVANRRRQKLIEAHKRQGKTPSADRLAWCDWTIPITNLPVELLSPEEACVIYRSRWQIELVFKRGKSQGLIADLQSSSLNRNLVKLWARLLAVILQHWLLLTSVWGDRSKSLAKACDAIRKFTGCLAAGIESAATIQAVIPLIAQATNSTVRQNKRKKPSSFELLNDVELLEYSLT